MGKAMLIIFMGFAATFYSVQNNLQNANKNNADIVFSEYRKQVLTNTAASATNMAIAHLHQDFTWRAGYDSLSFSGGNFWVTVEGNAEIGGSLSVNGVGEGRLNLADSLSISHVLTVSTNSILHIDGDPSSGSGTIDGSGTAGTITKWQDTDTITDSVMTDDGSGIEINGDLSVGKSMTATDQLFVDGDPVLFFETDGYGKTQKFSLIKP